MRQTALLALVLVIALAGCSSTFSGPQTETGGTTPTETTAPPETTTAPAGTESPGPNGTEQLAPGVTREGIVNPVRLVSAHQDALLADGFVLNETVETTYDGTLSHRTQVRTVAGPGGELASQEAVAVGLEDGPVSEIHNDVWLNETTMTTRHVEAGSTTYAVRPRYYPPESLVSFAGFLQRLQLAADDYSVTDVSERDGIRFVTLETTGAEDADSRLVVSESGVIHEARMAVDYGEGNRYVLDYRVERVGGVEPTPPNWLDVVPPSASLQVGLDVFEFDETAIQLVNAGGVDAVPAGSTVTVVSAGTTYEAELSEPLAPGEPVTLWIDGNGSLVAGGEPSSDAGSFAGEVQVEVRAPDGGELFSIGIGR